jgi:hypothetical protein
LTARRLLDFDDPADFAGWRAVDDVVMGGVSSSAFEPAGPGVARFHGLVSLEYGGGFASVRTDPRDWGTSGATALRLRCLGDGHTYKCTLRVDDGFDGVQYQARFTPPAGDWAEIDLPLADFVATFRGRRLADAGPMRPERIRRLGLMISERQAGRFELQVDWLEVRYE